MTDDQHAVHNRIHIHPGARQVLLDLDKPVRRRLQRAIDGLADRAQPAGAVPLDGQPGVLRLPVGDHQVLYSVRGKAGSGSGRHGRDVVVLVIDEGRAALA